MKFAALSLALFAAAGLGAEDRMIGRDAARTWVYASLRSAQKTIDLRLGRFDDDDLIGKLGHAVSRGARVRVLADPDSKSTRLAAKKARALGLSLRWSTQGPAFYLLADGQTALLGAFDGDPDSLDLDAPSLALFDEGGVGALFAASFDREWRGLSEALPEKFKLEEQLEALPDPRDNEPRVRTKRRKN